MRKEFHEKRRSCGLCKPHKQGWQRRWKAKDLSIVREAELEIESARRVRSMDRNL